MSAVPVGRQPVQARAVARVESILGAASRIIADRGISALTMTEVAAQAAVAIGSLYQYFPSETSLVATLAERHLRSGRERLLEDLSNATRTAEPAAAMHSALRTYLRVGDDPLSAELMGAIRADPALRALDRADTRANARAVVEAFGLQDADAALRVGLIIDLAGHLALDLPSEPPRRRQSLTGAFIEMADSVLQLGPGPVTGHRAGDR